MYLFYSFEIREGLALFDETESRHAIKSLRMSLNDSIKFTDGQGRRYAGIISTAHEKKMVASNLQIIEEIPPISPHICLAFAPTKSGDRFEFMVEKCVEIGVQEFRPFISFHSDRKNINIDRLEKIALSAMKQSNQLFLPKIHPAQNFKALVESLKSSSAANLIAYCGEKDLPIIKNIDLSEESNITLFIGPEGDFSPEEFQIALAHGFKGVNLGPNRLRTETAGLVACHWLRTMFY